MTSILGPDGKQASLRVDAEGRLLTTGGGVGSDFSGVYADLPAANAVTPGFVAQVADYNNTFWVSDGTYWRPAGRQTLYGWQTTFWPSGEPVNWTDRSGAHVLNLATQVLVPKKLIAPGTEIRGHTLARKLGGTSTGNLQVNLRASPFSSASDLSGSTALGSGTAAAAIIWSSNDGKVWANANNQLMLQHAWFAQTAVSSSAAIQQSPHGWSTAAVGLYFCISASLSAGSTDTWELVRYCLEVA